mmetsp:Transcript_23930/g.74494  ORF Transcript_23930/g.74494 Transcript_23930/m.74494 type:complete len:269 (-) Transcript_23930:623-1429(-)
MAPGAQGAAHESRGFARDVPKARARATPRRARRVGDDPCRGPAGGAHAARARALGELRWIGSLATGRLAAGEAAHGRMVGASAARGRLNERGEEIGHARRTAHGDEARGAPPAACKVQQAGRLEGAVPRKVKLLVADAASAHALRGLPGRACGEEREVGQPARHLSPTRARRGPVAACASEWVARPGEGLGGGDERLLHAAAHGAHAPRGCEENEDAATLPRGASAAAARTAPRHESVHRRRGAEGHDPRLECPGDEGPHARRAPGRP